MNTINPNNFEGSSVTLVGRTGGKYRTKEFSNGSSIAELSIAVGKGYKKDGEWVSTGTDWYTLTATKDYAEDHWDDIPKGAKVRLDEARLETREYSKKDGTPGIALNLRYGRLSVLSNPKESDGFTPDDDDTVF